jgi:hypothetical protein
MQLEIALKMQFAIALKMQFENSVKPEVKIQLNKMTVAY